MLLDHASHRRPGELKPNKNSLAGAINRLERDLLVMPQAGIKTKHTFRPRIYERTITIPAWTVLTGAEHKTDYSVRLESGTIAVNTDDGIRVLTGPCTFKARAGAKRVGRVFDAPVVWTDVYDNPDDCTDIATLEARLYQLEGIDLGENRQALVIEHARADFSLFLAQIGATQEDMDGIVKTDFDLIPMPPGFDVEQRPSIIHGTGMFAMRAFSAGEIICPGRLSGMRTPAGRFINHSPSPNAASYMHPSGDIWAVATREIQENEEVLIDYRNSMRINFGIAIQGESPCQVG